MVMREEFFAPLLRSKRISAVNNHHKDAVFLTAGGTFCV